MSLPEQSLPVTAKDPPVRYGPKSGGFKQLE